VAFAAVIPWAQRGAATYLPPAQLAEGLVATWKELTGGLPYREVAELLLAQVLIETNWSRSMWRYNWGNITAGSSWTGAIWRPSWYELTPESSARDLDLNAKMLVGKAPKAFRAYSSHQEGAADYVRLLLRQFRPMVVAAETGDPVAFSEAVRTSSYCPDCGSEKFVRSIRSLQSQIRAGGWLSYLPSARSGSSWVLPALGAAVLGGAAAAGAVLLIRATER